MLFQHFKTTAKIKKLKRVLKTRLKIFLTIVFAVRNINERLP